MITNLITNVYEDKQYNGQRVANEFRGLSTDTKPTEHVNNGDIFIEMDTSSIYFYDKTNEVWRKF